MLTVVLRNCVSDVALIDPAAGTFHVPPSEDSSDDSEDSSEEFPSDDDDDDDACFSPYSVVHVEGLGRTYMEDLKIGDRVETPNGYAQVYSFGHKKGTGLSTYLQIQTTACAELMERKRQVCPL